MIQYLIRLFRRRSLLKRSRWRILYRSFIIFIFISIFICFFILFIHFIYIFQSNHSESYSSDIIISLTSISARFHYELPYTIHSLLSQTQLPKQIRIYLSPTSEIIKQNNLTLTHLKMYIQHLDSSKTIEKLFDKLVEIRLEQEDYGPATKFLPIIKEFQSASIAIMICDDDQYYHSNTLETLNTYSNEFPYSIIGLRGWRVRKDFRWGVESRYQMFFHIVESHYITEIYRVGVLTANSAYLIRPSFFDSRIYSEFIQAPNDIRLVDDIWLNGQASKRNISRYVVPSCCPHISVTQTHALEENLGKNHINRSSANSHALQWFNESWEKDLWYKFHGENAPKYHSWWMMIYQEWISMILNFKFIVIFILC